MDPSSSSQDAVAEPGLATRLRRLRNHLLAHPRFQRWAARIPLMRGIARGRASELFDLVAGFTYSQTLVAVVDSQLLDVVADRPLDTATVATAIDLSPEAAARLLKAASALSLIDQVSPDHWMLSGRGAVLRAKPGVQAMIRHHRALYTDLADPLALLRADRRKPTALSRYWRYDAADQSRDSAPYSELMAASQAMVAEEVLATYDFGRHRSLLDVGGGYGVFLSAVAAAYPRLRLGLLDLPSVIAGAEPRIAKAGIGERVDCHPGDFFADPIPSGYDCITLVRVLHDHDDDEVRRLLRNIRAGLAPGSRLMVAEPMARTRGAEAMGDAYFGLYLWAMNSGRPRTAREIVGLIDASGFRRPREVLTAQPLVARIIVADA